MTVQTGLCRTWSESPKTCFSHFDAHDIYLFQGPDSFYGSKGLRKVTHESVSSGKVTFQFHYAAGNNNGTSVEDGQVPEIIFYT